MAKENQKTSSQKGGGNSDVVAEQQGVSLDSVKNFKLDSISYDQAEDLVVNKYAKDNMFVSIALDAAKANGYDQPVKEIFETGAKTMMMESLWFGFRDIAHAAADILDQQFLEKALKDNPEARLAINLTTNAAIVLARPLMLAKNALDADYERRESFIEQLEPFKEAYGETVTSSVINPLGRPENLLLQKLQNRLDNQSHERDGEILTSAVMGTFQAVGRKILKDNLANRIDEKVASQTGDINERLNQKKDVLEYQKELAKHATFQNISSDGLEGDDLLKWSKLQDEAVNIFDVNKDNEEKIKNHVDGLIDKAQKSYDKTANILQEIVDKANKSKQSVRFQSWDLGANPEVYDGVKIYNDPKFSITSGALLAGGATSALANNILEKTHDQPQKTSLIAADLILYLNKKAQEGDLTSGIVHLDELKKKHTLPKDWGNQMKLEQFVELIFNTHVHDQSGDKIPERFHPKLSEISKEIADALTKPSADLRSEATLHPLALIDLVGSGKMVAHDGLHVTTLATAQEEIADAIRTMPILPQMDTVRYLEELGSNYKLPPDEMATQLKDNLRGMDKETRDFMALLIPSQVLVNELGVDGAPLQESRARASDYALDNFKELVVALAEKDAGDMAKEGLTRKQVQLIREAALHIESGNDDALLNALRNRETDGVGFAILSAKETMQELADGKKLVGYEALQAQKQRALEEKQVSQETLEAHAENVHKREARDKTEGVSENHNPAKHSKVVQGILKDAEIEGDKPSLIDRIIGKKEEQKDLSNAEKVAAGKTAEPKERSLAG